MDDFMAIESCAFDLSLMECNAALSNKMNSLNIQMMESSANNDAYFEGVADSTKKFITDIIKKVKEFFEKAWNTINDKIKEMKFQSMCREIKKRYASMKADTDGSLGMIRVFEYRLYYSEANDMIRRFHKTFAEIGKRKWKSADEVTEYLNDSLNKITAYDTDRYDTLTDAIKLAKTCDEYVVNIKKGSTTIQKSLYDILNDIDKQLVMESTENDHPISDKVEDIRTKFRDKVDDVHNKIRNARIRGYQILATKIASYSSTSTRIISRMTLLTLNGIHALLRITGGIDIYTGGEDMRNGFTSQQQVNGLKKAARGTIKQLAANEIGAVTSRANRLVIDEWKNHKKK